MKVLKRILLGVGIFFGATVLVMAVMMLTLNSANASKGDHEEILRARPSQASPKKALVVYQPSFTSISGDAAHRIAKGLNNGGFEMTLNNPGDFLETDLSQYAVVVFGSPVYAGKASKALTGYMEKTTGFSACKIALYSTGASIDKSPELDKMEGALNGAAVVKKVKFDVNDKEQADTLAYDFGAELAK